MVGAAIAVTHTQIVIPNSLNPINYKLFENHSSNMFQFLKMYISCL